MLSAPHPRAAMSLLWTAVVLTLPGLVLRLLGFHPHDAPLLGLFVFGLTIVSAAFLLTWAAEVAEADIGSGLAVVFLALVTVLPEYAVDIYFAWKAGHEPAYQAYALANMTGANRLLIGIGWPTVALLVWYRQGANGVRLHRTRSVDVVWLGIATLYSLVVPLKGTLAWYDALVLFACYGLYVRGARGGEEAHAEPVGPPQVMTAWAPSRRRRWTLALFVWSAGAILMASEPFSESLLAAGHRIGVDEVLLVQWLAPLASEAPEFVVVVLLTLRGRAAMALGTFLSSKINQWTLLVGGVPIAFGLSRLSHGAPFPVGLPLDARMTEELWLTAAQGLYATATVADLHFSLRQALAILGLFLVQFLGSIVLESTGHHAALGSFHDGLAVLYGVLAIERFVSQRSEARLRLRDAFRGPPPASPSLADGPPDRGGRGSPDESDA